MPTYLRVYYRAFTTLRMATYGEHPIGYSDLKLYYDNNYFYQPFDCLLYYVQLMDRTWLKTMGIDREQKMKR